MKNGQLEEKWSTKSVNGAKYSAQGDKKFKEKLHVKQSKGSVDHRGRPQSANLTTHEEELKESVSVEGTYI